LSGAGQTAMLGEFRRTRAKPSTLGEQVPFRRNGITCYTIYKWDFLCYYKAQKILFLNCVERG